MKSTLNRSYRFLAAAFVAGVTCVTLAHAALVGVGPSEVQFQAVGPAGLKIEGTGHGVSASEADGKVKIESSLMHLKTGISLRDDHLRKAIDAPKHPTATMVVPRSALKFPEEGKTVEGKAKGDFTLHGVTRPLDFAYKATKDKGAYQVQGLTTIDITDFKIEVPCYLGVCVDRTVKIKVKFGVKDQ